MSRLIAAVSGGKGSVRPMVAQGLRALNGNQDWIPLFESAGENNPVINKLVGQYGMLFRSAELKHSFYLI
ncbi:hypothetical protein [Pseudomonas sp. GW456-L15]|uniref:hypothetical protein n=1 Tax=Pseudomonas sp. GW456-L15 TaxID=2751353 RepID=UPI001A9152FF|nr:hypothetical protein [Pseudomonas sp. GW456-L15]